MKSAIRLDNLACRGRKSMGNFSNEQVTFAKCQFCKGNFDFCLFPRNRLFGSPFLKNSQLPFSRAIQNT
jgi:hypothetical protein